MKDLMKKNEEIQVVETAFVLVFKNTHKHNGGIWYYKKGFGFEFNLMEDATTFRTYLKALECFKNMVNNKIHNVEEGRYYVVDSIDGEEVEITLI